MDLIVIVKLLPTVADLTEPVTRVNAQLDSVDGQRTVRLTWEVSHEIQLLYTK